MSQSALKATVYPIFYQAIKLHRIKLKDLPVLFCQHQRSNFPLISASPSRQITSSATRFPHEFSWVRKPHQGEPRVPGAAARGHEVPSATGAALSADYEANSGAETWGHATLRVCHRFVIYAILPQYLGTLEVASGYHTGFGRCWSWVRNLSGNLLTWGFILLSLRQIRSYLFRTSNQLKDQLNSWSGLCEIKRKSDYADDTHEINLRNKIVGIIWDFDSIFKLNSSLLL